jgi:four helix bundle protein
VDIAEKRNKAARIGADLEERTLAFATRIVEFASALPRTEPAIIIGRQLLRSGTSIGANYREANRAESRDDFAHKIAIAVKEAAEAEYWLILCQRVNLGAPESRAMLASESNELIAILSTILRRARRS